MNREEFAELFARPCSGSHSWAVNHALSVIPKNAPDREGLAEDATQEVALYFLEHPDKLEAAEGPGAIHYVILRRVIDELRKLGRRPIGIGPDIEEYAVGSQGADLDAEGDELVDAFLAEFQGSTAARQSLLADLLKPENEHATKAPNRSVAYRKLRERTTDRVNRLRSPRTELGEFIDEGKTEYRESLEHVLHSERAKFQSFEHSLSARPRVLDLEDAAPEELHLDPEVEAVE